MIIASLFILLANQISAEQISPGCNYAATSTHFYPIGGCETIKTVSDTGTRIYSAFKYVCYGNNEVYKLSYSGNDDYCDGKVISSEKVTNSLQGFECDSTICGFADGCSSTGCIVNNSCSQCIKNANDYNKHCVPFITDHCHGNVGELLKYDTCSQGILSENIYYGADCSDINKIFDIKSGGFDSSTNCYDNAYFTTSCNTALLTPHCNYAASNLHFYPINGCDKTKTINPISGEIEYFAFQYVCDGQDIFRKEYNTKKYCDDDNPVSIRKHNEILRYFECDLTECKYADSCSKTGCVVNGDCTLCENKQKDDFNMHCLPIITAQCIGVKGEILVDAVCDDKNNNNHLLTENFYFDDECLDIGFSIKSGSNDKNINCKHNSFTFIDCTPYNNDKNGGKATGKDIKAMDGDKSIGTVPGIDGVLIGDKYNNDKPMYGDNGGMNIGTGGDKSSGFVSEPDVALIGDKYNNVINDVNNNNNNKPIYDENGGMNEGKGVNKSSAIASGPAAVFLGNKHNDDINDINNNTPYYVIHGYSLSFIDLCLSALLGLLIICCLYRYCKHKICADKNDENQKIDGYRDDESKSFF